MRWVMFWIETHPSAWVPEWRCCGAELQPTCDGQVIWVDRTPVLMQARTAAWLVLFCFTTAQLILSYLGIHSQGTDQIWGGVVNIAGIAWKCLLDDSQVPYSVHHGKDRFIKEMLFPTDCQHERHGSNLYHDLTLDLAAYLPSMLECYLPVYGGCNYLWYINLALVILFQCISFYFFSSLIAV